MIVWVLPSATGSSKSKDWIYIRSETELGDNAPAIIFAHEVCGIEIEPGLVIKFKVTTIEWSN